MGKGSRGPSSHPGLRGNWPSTTGINLEVVEVMVLLKNKITTA